MRVVQYSSKKCTKCGKMFIPRNPRHEWCDECLTKQCAYCGKKFHVGKKPDLKRQNFAAENAKESITRSIIPARMHFTIKMEIGQK